MNKIKLIINLKELGLKKGDIILLHSALSSIGHIEGGVSAFIDSFLEVITEEGTLAVPSFTGGIVPEYVKNHKESITSINPYASISAIGKDAEYLCRDHWKCETAHAEGTPYIKLAELGGYICLFGVDQDRNTTLHSVEALLKLPYLKETEKSKIETPEGKIETSFKYFPGPHRDFIGLDKTLRKSGKMKTVKIGTAVVRLIKSKDLLDIILEKGKQAPSFALCDNPNCTDCVNQKALLFADKIKKEEFTLSASSLLAGRYVPEIIENCKKSGISNIELDYIQGKPAYSYSIESIKKYINEFTNSGIYITGIRFEATPDNTEKTFKKLKEAEINNIILPISVNTDEINKTCKNINLKALFYNIAISSKTASDKLVQIKNTGTDAGLAFSPAGFTLANEKPFLQSFKSKAKRFIKQLYIEDITFTGLPQIIGNGNSEIKELISILRCSSFDGTFVLGRKNVSTGNLMETTKQFESLLNSM
jgi:aminoglycoside 3-N-acetyltransferase